MGSDWKSQLQAIYGTKNKSEEPPPQPAPAPEPVIACPESGAACPLYFNGSITEAFARYEAEFSDKDFEDPRGIRVTLLSRNFVKLTKLRYKPHPGRPDQKAKISAVLDAMKNGTFDEAKHFSEQPIRLHTLFWIRDVIEHPDGIYPNNRDGHRVDGDEVYFKRYDKAGSDIKLVFTEIVGGGQRIVITSFMDKPSGLKTYCALPALWPVKN